MDDLFGDRLLAIIETQNEIAATALDLPAVMAIVVKRAQELTGAAAAVLALPESDQMVCRAASGTASAGPGLRLNTNSSLSGSCVLEGKVVRCVDAGTDPRVDAEACMSVGAISMVCAPLSRAEQVAGVLEVYDPGPDAFDEADVATLELLAGVIASHMSRSSVPREQDYSGYHDPLTGLLNRRAFDQRLGDELARSTRHGGGFALCMLDLDHFKPVNDTLGHDAGDDVLRAVAGHLGALRDEDAAYRLRNDEFALVLIEASAEGVEVVIRRISSAIQHDPRCHGVGASWGATNVKRDDDTASIVARADAALDAAKRPVPV